MTEQQLSRVAADLPNTSRSRYVNIHGTQVVDCWAFHHRRQHLARRHLHHEHRFVLDGHDEGIFGPSEMVMMRYTMQHRPEATLE